MSPEGGGCGAFDAVDHDGRHRDLDWLQAQTDCCKRVRQCRTDLAHWIEFHGDVKPALNAGSVLDISAHDTTKKGSKFGHRGKTNGKVAIGPACRIEPADQTPRRDDASVPLIRPHQL